MKNMGNIGDIRAGDILTDLTGKDWKLGNVIGHGAFGQIFIASDDLNHDVPNNSEYVVKVESYTNGPLFVEINCYLRIAKIDHINEWKSQRHLQHLGMPHYVASGTHMTRGNKYRFLIMPRYNNDLESVLNKHGNRFNLKTAVTISLQLLNILEYIHANGYLHSDIKAANIVLRNQLRSRNTNGSKREGICNNLRTYRPKPIVACTRNLRPKSNIRYVDQMESDDEDEKGDKDYNDENGNQQCSDVVLLDFGLASRYLTSSGAHKSCCADERKAHAGTVLFCSLDAHTGAQSRRSDLESLGYNIIYWLTADLPWAENTDLDYVERSKQECLTNLHEFLKNSFKTMKYPKFLYDYFKYLACLEFASKPDYNYLRKLFTFALRDYGYQNDNVLDFENLNSNTLRTKSGKVPSENVRTKAIKIKRIMRSPLKSNITVQPKTRKKTKIARQLNWSKILIDNPEVILKKARDRKLTESSDTAPTAVNVANLDIKRLNPTPAMLDVYRKYQDGVATNNVSPRYRGDSCVDRIEGYTSAMMTVYQRMQDRILLENTIQLLSNKRKNNNVRIKSRKSRNSTTAVPTTPSKSKKPKRSNCGSPTRKRTKRTQSEGTFTKALDSGSSKKKCIIGKESMSRLKKVTLNVKRQLRSCRLTG